MEILLSGLQAVSRIIAVWIVAIAAIAALWILWPTKFPELYDMHLQMDSVVDERAYKWGETTQKLIAQRIDVSQKLFQVAIALIASLWGLVVAAPGQSRELFNDWEDRVSIIVATLLLGLSCWYHLSFTKQMVAIQLEGIATDYVMNPSSPLINAERFAQVACIVVAAFIVAATIVLDLWVCNKSSKNESDDTIAKLPGKANAV